MPPFPELKDITPPTPPPFSSPEEIQALVWMVFGGVVALVVLGLLWLWWRRRTRHQAPPLLPRSPLDQLRDRLASLQSSPEPLPATQLGHEVAGAVRSYLQREHGLMARYRTTEELFGTHRGPRRSEAPPPLPFLQPFAEVFTRCDALRFTKPGQLNDRRSELITLALQATDQVRTALAPRPIPSPGTPPPLPGAIATPSDPAPPLAMTAEIVPPVHAAAPQPAPPSDPAFLCQPEPAEPRPAAASPAAATAGPMWHRTGPRSDAFTRPQSNAFARGADIIPA